MSEITVGIVCATRFCEASGKEFSAYIDYIDRDEATKKDNIDKFKLGELLAGGGAAPGVVGPGANK